MKKILMLISILFFSLALILNSLIPVYATETGDNNMKNDSISIPSTIADEYKTNPSHNVIFRFYNGYFMLGFAQKATIQEIINNPDYVLEEVYATSVDGITMYRAKRNGTLTDPLDHHSEGNIFRNYALSPNKLFKKSTFSSSDLTIDSIYCLDGEPSHDGIYIYFTTNKGDYIYYKEYASAEKEYLFPINEFYDFAKAIADERIQNGALDGAFKPIEEIYNIANYEITEKNTPILSWLLPLIIFLLIAAGCIIGLFLKKSSHLNTIKHN